MINNFPVQSILCPFLNRIFEGYKITLLEFTSTSKIKYFFQPIWVS